MKRVLCIVGCMDAGGAETFLMKMYRSIDKDKYQMDFCVSARRKGFYDDEIEEMGGRIIPTSPKSKGFIKSFKSIKKIVKQNKYEYVLRVSQHSLSAMELVAARAGGARTLIYRSSNSSTGGGLINRILHRLCLFMSIGVPDVKIAPSTEAAEFMFGKNSVKKGRAHLLHNAIDIDKYLYNQAARESVREELDISDKLVVGHIGRFAPQKNHEFLLDIFGEISKRQENAVLLLVGTGELQEKIKKKAHDMEIADKVMFLGVRSDIPKILSAMDIFLFPSFFEGMPNTVIEAQGSGLSCIIADTITKEADITGLVEYMPLSADKEAWAKKCIDTMKSIGERRNTKEDFVREKYDIKSGAEEFVRLIFG